jgi:hypothetical protein
MMSRASRMLKWPVAATVLLAAAPIAYAGQSTASTAHTGQSGAGGAADPARCAGRAADFAGSYTVAGHGDTRYGFDAATMTAHGTAPTAAGTASATGNGTWQAGSGEIRWTVDARTYTAKPADVMCADPGAGAQVTSLTATAADGSGTVTLVRS